MIFKVIAQEVLNIRVIAQELLNNIIYDKIIKVIVQEVLNKDGISVIVQEVQLS